MRVQLVAKKDIKMIVNKSILIFVLGIICHYCVFCSQNSTNATVNSIIKSSYNLTKMKTNEAQFGKLIFYETFDTLNTTIWEPIVTLSGCGTREFQMYHRYSDNLFVQDGVLHIQPTLTSDLVGLDFLSSGNLVLAGCTDPLFNGCNKTGRNGHILNPVISARIRTMNSFYFQYGKVEVRAKIPVGDWLFPAIWLNPKFKTYGPWPMSGEIDLMESRGNPHLYDGTGEHVGIQQVQSTLHFGTNTTNDAWRRAHATRNSKFGFHLDFHNYQFIWTPEYMSFAVDDVEHLKIQPPKGGFYELGKFQGENIWSKNFTNPSMAPFDQPFYLLINVAVGGSSGYFSDEFVNSPKPKPWKTGESMDEAMLKFWNNREDWLATWKKPDSAFKIDHVKVWAYKPPSSCTWSIFCKIIHYFDLTMFLLLKLLS